METEVIHVKMKESEVFFPWVKKIRKKLLKSFCEENADDHLLLQQQLHEEFSKLLYSKDKMRVEAFYKIISYFYLHFCWRVNWNKDYPMKFYCVQLLYYMVIVGLLLSNGDITSHWMDKVLTALKSFQGDPYLMFDAVLLIKNIKKKHRQAYFLILKHILCKDVIKNPSDSESFMKIILLFRRLKCLSEGCLNESTISSVVSKVKCPPYFVKWISLNIGSFSGLSCRNVAEDFLNRNLKSRTMKKIFKVLFENKYDENIIKPVKLQNDSDKIKPLSKKFKTSKICNQLIIYKAKAVKSETCNENSVEILEEKNIDIKDEHQLKQSKDQSDCHAKDKDLETNSIIFDLSAPKSKQTRKRIHALNTASPKQKKGMSNKLKRSEISVSLPSFEINNAKSWHITQGETYNKIDDPISAHVNHSKVVNHYFSLTDNSSKDKWCWKDPAIFSTTLSSDLQNQDSNKVSGNELNDVCNININYPSIFSSRKSKIENFHVPLHDGKTASATDGFIKFAKSEDFEITSTVLPYDTTNSNKTPCAFQKMSSEEVDESNIKSSAKISENFHNSPNVVVKSHNTEIDKENINKCEKIIYISVPHCENVHEAFYASCSQETQINDMETNVIEDSYCKTKKSIVTCESSKDNSDSLQITGSKSIYSSPESLNLEELYSTSDSHVNRKPKWSESIYSGESSIFSISDINDINTIKSASDSKSSSPNSAEQQRSIKLQKPKELMLSLDNMPLDEQIIKVKRVGNVNNIHASILESFESNSDLNTQQKSPSQPVNSSNTSTTELICSQKLSPFKFTKLSSPVTSTKRRRSRKQRKSEEIISELGSNSSDENHTSNSFRTSLNISNPLIKSGVEDNTGGSSVLVEANSVISNTALSEINSNVIISENCKDESLYPQSLVHSNSGHSKSLHEINVTSPSAKTLCINSGKESSKVQKSQISESESNSCNDMNLTQNEIQKALNNSDAEYNSRLLTLKIQSNVCHLDKNSHHFTETCTTNGLEKINDSNNGETKTLHETISFGKSDFCVSDSEFHSVSSSDCETDYVEESSLNTNFNSFVKEISTYNECCKIQACFDNQQTLCPLSPKSQKLNHCNSLLENNKGFRKESPTFERKEKTLLNDSNNEVCQTPSEIPNNSKTNLFTSKNYSPVEQSLHSNGITHEVLPERVFPCVNSDRKLKSSKRKTPTEIQKGMSIKLLASNNYLPEEDSNGNSYENQSKSERLSSCVDLKREQISSKLQKSWKFLSKSKSDSMTDARLSRNEIQNPLNDSDAEYILRSSTVKIHSKSHSSDKISHLKKMKHQAKKPPITPKYISELDSDFADTNKTLSKNELKRDGSTVTEIKVSLEPSTLVKPISHNSDSEIHFIGTSGCNTGFLEESGLITNSKSLIEDSSTPNESSEIQAYSNNQQNICSLSSKTEKRSRCNLLLEGNKGLRNKSLIFEKKEDTLLNDSNSDLCKSYTPSDIQHGQKIKLVTSDNCLPEEPSLDSNGNPYKNLAGSEKLLSYVDLDKKRRSSRLRKKPQRYVSESERDSFKDPSLSQNKLYNPVKNVKKIKILHEIASSEKSSPNLDKSNHSEESKLRLAPLISESDRDSSQSNGILTKKGNKKISYSNNMGINNLENKNESNLSELGKILETPLSKKRRTTPLVSESDGILTEKGLEKTGQSNKMKINELEKVNGSTEVKKLLGIASSRKSNYKRKLAQLVSESDNAFSESEEILIGKGLEKISNSNSMESIVLGKQSESNVREVNNSLKTSNFSLDKSHHFEKRRPALLDSEAGDDSLQTNEIHAKNGLEKMSDSNSMEINELVKKKGTSGKEVKKLFETSSSVKPSCSLNKSSQFKKRKLRSAPLECESNVYEFSDKPINQTNGKKLSTENVVSITLPETESLSKLKDDSNKHLYFNLNKHIHIKSNSNSLSNHSEMINVSYRYFRRNGTCCEKSQSSVLNENPTAALSYNSLQISTKEKTKILTEKMLESSCNLPENEINLRFEQLLLNSPLTLQFQVKPDSNNCMSNKNLIQGLTQSTINQPDKVLSEKNMSQFFIEKHAKHDFQQPEKQKCRKQVSPKKVVTNSFNNNWVYLSKLKRIQQIKNYRYPIINCSYVKHSKNKPGTFLCKGECFTKVKNRFGIYFQKELIIHNSKISAYPIVDLGQKCDKNDFRQNQSIQQKHLKDKGNHFLLQPCINKLLKSSFLRKRRKLFHSLNINLHDTMSQPNKRSAGHYHKAIRNHVANEDVTEANTTLAQSMPKGYNLRKRVIPCFSLSD